MTMLTIIIAIISLIGLWLFIIGFNKHCMKNFGHRFFTMPIVITLGITGGLFLLGMHWYSLSVATDKSGYELMGIFFNQGTLNSVVLIAFSITIYLAIAIYNFVKTNWVYGLIGTIVQFGLLTVFAYFGIILLAVYFVASALATSPRVMRDMYQN